MNFKLTQTHVDRLKPTIKQYGHVYIHGDGQMYINVVIKETNGTSRTISKSWEHVNFHTSAPGDHRHEYVVKYNKNSKLPTTVDELVNDLVAAKAQADLRDSMPETSKSLHILAEDLEGKKDLKANK